VPLLTRPASFNHCNSPGQTAASAVRHCRGGRSLRALRVFGPGVRVLDAALASRMAGPRFAPARFDTRRRKPAESHGRFPAGLTG
jgi:hypothetical protein